MDWLPWVVGVLLVALAVGAALVRRRRPGRRPAPTGRPAPRPPAKKPPKRPEPGWVVRPLAGDIWWADVPFEDGTGSKVRPCLVLRVGRTGAEVLKITSQDKSRRTDHIRIPTRTWDPGADHDSYLDLTDPIRVAAASFQDRAGALDASLWREVRKLHAVR